MINRDLRQDSLEILQTRPTKSPSVSNSQVACEVRSTRASILSIGGSGLNTGQYSEFRVIIGGHVSFFCQFPRTGVNTFTLRPCISALR